MSGQGNIKVHSHQEQRFRCTSWGKTFAASKSTPCYRLHKERSLFVIVIPLLTHGCPLQAIVAAFRLDERTVADWNRKAGSHCQGLHQHHLDTRKVDLQHTQADERYARCVGGRCWMAMAMAVPYRLWLGGVVSPVRNLHLIQRLVDMVRLAWLPGTAWLIGVDGLSSSVTAFGRAFREKVRTGRRGRPPYRLPGCVWLAQVIKRYAGRCLEKVCRRVLWGSQVQVEQQLPKTRTGRQINTSSIERLNATFRACRATRVRRGRALARGEGTLERGMYLVGCVYNFCETHRSLRVQQERGKKWLQRTPAMAVGWTDHIWSVEELLSFKWPVSLHG
jgi:hypothetical protein